MFKNIKAKTIYRFYDGKDDSKFLEIGQMGQRKFNNCLFELLNYFTIKSDGGFFCKATLDICTKGFDSLGLGACLEFSDWDEENTVMFSDYSKINAPVSIKAGNYKYPATLIFLPKLEKGCILFMENKSGGFDVSIDYFIKDGKARVGSHVIHSGKILHPADRVEINQCIYTLDAYCLEDVKTFYKARTKSVVNVNPAYIDQKIWASDSRIIMGDLN